MGPAAPTRRDADGMAVAAFVLGLVGLLHLNLLLGPMAVRLALLALRRGTGHRRRALLGLALGVADLAVFAALVAAYGTVSRNLGRRPAEGAGAIGRYTADGRSPRTRRIGAPWLTSTTPRPLRCSRRRSRR
ncbi:hypothetical protein ACE14D_26860 [Streptomyces sp. Act-28]